jgi:hypothetical protein
MKTTRKLTRPFFLMIMAIAMLMSLGQSALAFSDTETDKNRDAIRALQDAGIVQGEKKGTFNPHGQITYASGIALLVKAFEFNIDHMRFFKMPLASDHYPNAKDDAWYSDAFVIAAYSGLEIPRDVRPEAKMTREQFAHHLFRAISQKGDFAYTEQYILIDDEAGITPDYMNSIQKLLITNIAELNEKQQFEPQAAMTRGEAAGWLHRALRFVRSALEQQTTGEESASHPLYDLSLSHKAVNEQVREVTISAQAPHPGYGIRISSITFDGTKAVIHTEPVLPDPDRMYAQVITEVKAITYVGSQYEPILAETAGVSSGSSSSSDASNASGETKH